MFKSFGNLVLSALSNVVLYYIVFLFGLTFFSYNVYGKSSYQSLSEKQQSYKQIGKEELLRQRELKTIKGRVLDVAGKGVAGAVIRIKPGNYYALADSAGYYVIRGKCSATSRMYFSSLGYKTQMKILENVAYIEVTLLESTQSLKESVVRARTNINEIDVRNKVGVVEKVDIQRVSSKPMIDFSLALQGQIPGLLVSNTGELGAPPKIRIRGNSSLRKGDLVNEPLYVMDGHVISAETFYNLNPQDIKSMKVLKDAVALALYGIKAANGVLEVTSQRGYKGALAVSYNSNIGITTRGRRGLRMMKSKDKLELERRLESLNCPGYRYSEDYFNKYFPTALNLQDMIADGKSKLDSLKNIDTDWFDILIKNNVYHRHNLSIRGGDDNISYYISGNYSYQGGRIEGNNRQRMGFRLNLDRNIADLAYLSFSVDGANSLTKTPIGNSFDPTSLVYSLNPYESTKGKLVSYSGKTFNDLLYQHKAESNDKNISVSGSFVLQAVKGLDLAAVAGMDFVLEEGFNFTPSTAYSERKSGVRELARGIYAKYKNTNANISSNFRATYNNTFAEKHELTLGGNVDWYYNKIDNVYMKGYGVGTICSPNAINQSLKGHRQPYVDGFRSRVAQIGMGILSSYSYNSIYDIYASFKADASSVLPKSKRWNKAWAIGAAWSPSQYAFLKGNKYLSKLNFRTSYGWTANLNGVDASSTIASFKFSSASYGEIRPLDFIGLYNKDLKAELNKSYDFGLNMELFSRLTLDLNFYNRITEQALLDVPIPWSTGFVSLKRNIGVLQNTGIESRLKVNVIDTYDARVAVAVSMSYNKNEVLDLYYTDKIYTSEESLIPEYQKGKSYDMLYGPYSLGIHPFTGYPVFLSNGQEKHASEVLKKGDFIALGHLTPPFNGSINLSFSYKSLDFDMDFYYVFGGVNRFNYSYVRDKDSAHKNAVAGQLENMWFKVGDENKLYPTPFYSSPTAHENQTLYPNSKTIGKSDYLKLSMLSLRYRFSSSFLKKYLPVIKYANCAFQASNVFTLSSYKESDPESGQLAGTMQPVFSININLTF